MDRVPVPPSAALADACFAALADPTRRRLLALLRKQDELCVCEFTQATGLSQPKVSRHLATLKDAGLVVPRRIGTWIHYRLADELPPWTGQVLAALAEGAVSELAVDLERLQAMQQRPDRCN